MTNSVDSNSSLTSMCLVFLQSSTQALIEKAGSSTDLFNFMERVAGLATRNWGDLNAAATLRDCAVDSLGQLKCHFDVCRRDAAPAETIEQHVRELIGFGDKPVISYTLGC